MCKNHTTCLHFSINTIRAAIKSQASGLLGVLVTLKHKNDRTALHICLQVLIRECSRRCRVSCSRALPPVSINSVTFVLKYIHLKPSL